MNKETYNNLKTRILENDKEWLTGEKQFCEKVINMVGNDKIKDLMIEMLYDPDIIKKEKTNIYFLLKYCWDNEIEEKLLEAVFKYYQKYYADGFCSISQSFKNFMNKKDFENKFLDHFQKADNIDKQEKILMLLGFCIKLSDESYDFIVNLKSNKKYKNIVDTIEIILNSQKIKRNI